MFVAKAGNIDAYKKFVHFSNKMNFNFIHSFLLIKFYRFNDPNIREIEYASASGIGTAEALAKVYGIIANGGKTIDGKRLLSEQVINMIQQDGTRVKDEVFGVPTKFTLGFSCQMFQVLCAE